MIIIEIVAPVDLSSLTTTPVDIGASLPTSPKQGEGVSFGFDGLQDVDVYLGNSDKSVLWPLAMAAEKSDHGPFDADYLRNSGLTYIWGSASATAGTLYLAKVKE